MQLTDARLELSSPENLTKLVLYGKPFLESGHSATAEGLAKLCYCFLGFVEGLRFVFNAQISGRCEKVTQFVKTEINSARIDGEGTRQIFTTTMSQTDSHPKASRLMQFENLGFQRNIHKIFALPHHASSLRDQSFYQLRPWFRGRPGERSARWCFDSICFPGYGCRCSIRFVFVLQGTLCNSLESYSFAVSSPQRLIAGS
jgi:hypothetical protein